MKKILAILLAFVLTFSCVSLFSTGAALAEGAKENAITSNLSTYAAANGAEKVLFESDFTDDSANVVKFPSADYVKFLDSDSDGKNDYAELTGSAKVGNTAISAAIATGTFNITPGKDYVITYEMKVPEDSASYLYNYGSGVAALCPEFAVYQPDESKIVDGKVGDRHKESENEYAYKSKRRDAYESTVTIGDRSFQRNSYSSLGYVAYSSASWYGADAKAEELFADWTKVTIEFTGLASDDNAGAQLSAFCISLYKNIAGLKVQIKDIKVVEIDPDYVPETPDEPENPNEPVEPENSIRGPEVFEGFEDFAVGTKLYDHTLTGTQNMYTYSSKAVLLTTFGSLTVTNLGGYNGSKQSLTGTTYYQYAAMPVNLTPNTEYELSFWYTYTTSDNDKYIKQITYGMYKPNEGTSISESVALGNGTREMTDAFTPNEFAAGTWRKGKIQFTTGDNTEGIVFGYTYKDGSKADITAAPNKTPLFIDNVSIVPVEKAAKKANISFEHKNSASIDVISGYYKNFVVGEKVQFTVRTKDNLVPTVTINGESVTGNNGKYTFVAQENNAIKVVCEGDENRLDPNNYNGLPLYEYNQDVATTPIWEGNVVYHETALIVSGKETEKFTYPIDKVIAVRSYDLATTYIEGVDYEVTQDGQLRILEGSNIPVYADSLDQTSTSSFPIVGKDGTYAKFMNDYVYPAYAINVTYEHSKVWNADPVTIKSVASQIPNVMEKLQKGEDVTVIIFGDSASCGSCSSGQAYFNLIYDKKGNRISNYLNFAPYTPAWPVMVEQTLKTMYPDANITFRHIALGGTTAEWGKGVIAERIGYLARDYGLKAEDIDLMILGYGLNDLTAGHSIEKIGNNIQSIINNLRATTGEATEVLLWAEYRPRGDIKQFSEETLEALRQKNFELAKVNEGVAVADLNGVYNFVMESRDYYDVFNDAVIHGNDFLTRIIAQSILSALSVPETSDEIYLAGDIDNNGITDLSDVVALAQYVAGWDVTINEKLSDTNGDETIDLQDVVVLAQYVAGWDVEIFVPSAPSNPDEPEDPENPDNPDSPDGSEDPETPEDLNRNDVDIDVGKQ